MTDYTDLHGIQEKIIKRLSYSDEKSFSEIKGDIKSNKFAFHLDQLQEKDLIEKTDNGYSLTSEGREILPYFDLDEVHHPVIVVDLLVFSGDKVYLIPKEEDPLDPFEGSYRALSSRIGKMDRVEEKARMIFDENFESQVSQIRKSAVFDSQLTFKDGSRQHYIIFYFRAEIDEPEGENWHSIEELDDMDLLPGLEKAVRKIRWNEGFSMGKWDLIEEEDGFKVEKLDI